MRLLLAISWADPTTWFVTAGIALAAILVLALIRDWGGFRSWLTNITLKIPGLSFIASGGGGANAGAAEPTESDKRLVAPFEVHSVERIIDVCEHLNRMDRKLRDLLGTGRFAIKECKPAALANALIRSVLRALEDLLEKLIPVPGTIVFAIIKAPVPKNPVHLKCYYSDHEDGRREATHHQDADGNLIPEHVSRAETIAGHVLDASKPKPVFIGDVDNPPRFAPMSQNSQRDLQQQGVKSLVAYPIRYNKATVAVLWVDCNQVGALAEDLVLSSILRSAVAKISLILSIAQRDAAVKASRKEAEKVLLIDDESTSSENNNGK